MAQAISNAHFRIGIDTGGTFYRYRLRRYCIRQVAVTKVPSTPGQSRHCAGPWRPRHPRSGRRNIRQRRRHRPRHDGRDQRTSAKGRSTRFGLIVTEGFRHILEIARQSVPEGYGNSYFWVKPERIVPLRFVREAGGRFDFRGQELRPLDEQSVRQAVRFFRQQNIQAIGVCLMHSYANATHERRVAEIVAEEYPECALSLSCDVLPEYREYERAVTHAGRCIRQAAHGALSAARARRARRSQAEAVFWSCSRAAASPAPPEVMSKPITTALSGPAAGALGSAVISEIAGFPNIVTLDAGGTSTDLCLIEGGKPHVTNGGAVGSFPVRIPMIDIETIGTGGGSIAWITAKATSRSARRAPAPTPAHVLPSGGGHPTITDAPTSCSDGFRRF